MKKWWYSLLSLLLFAGPALASSSNPTISSQAVTDKTDISIAYLSSFFGTVSGVLSGTSGQMFGKLMYQFNQGMLVLAGFWLVFTVISMFVKAGVSGSFMQQDNKVPMILLRIAIGFGLLIPNPSTGYTVLQGIVMQVTVQGVNLADQIWEYGLDYMNNGGALWSRPMQTQSSQTQNIMSDDDIKAILGDASSTNATVDNFVTLSMIEKIVTMEACMVQSSIDNENQGDSSDSVSSQSTYSIYEDMDNFNFQFPGGSNADGNALCGTVYWSSVGSATTLGPFQQPPNTLSCSSTDNSDNSNCGFSHLALREVVFDLLPAVKKYICAQNSDNSGSMCNGVDPTDVDTNMTDAMTSALLNYKNLIDPMVRNQTASAGGVLDFINQAKKDGWMTAGRYYWDLISVEGAYDSAMSNSSVQTLGIYQQYIPNSYMAPDTNTIGSLTKSSPQNLLNAIVPGYINQVNNNIGNISTAASAGAATSVSGGGGLGWLSSLFAPVLMQLTRLFEAFSVNTGSLGLNANPILWMHNIGMICMSIGSNLWLGIAVGLFPVLLIANICRSENPMGPAIQGVLSWVQPLFMVAAAGFFAVGISLGFYIPLYPYMLFTFGIIGWLIHVIEAMVAAPIVAMGVTHPEGHDFLGRATQAVMLLVGVFIRPALMLIGLFAGMILCQVSLSVVLYTFSGFASDLFYISHTSSGSPNGDVLLNGVGLVAGNIMASGSQGWFSVILPILVYPLFLGLFTIIVYTVTTNCFSLIHHLPDYVLSWIGAPQAHGINAGHMVGEIQHGLSAASSRASGAFGETANAGGKALQKYLSDKKESTLNVDKNATPPSSP